MPDSSASNEVRLLRASSHLVESVSAAIQQLSRLAARSSWAAASAVPFARSRIATCRAELADLQEEMDILVASLLDMPQPQPVIAALEEMRQIIKKYLARLDAVRPTGAVIVDLEHFRSSARPGGKRR